MAGKGQRRLWAPLVAAGLVLLLAGAAWEQDAAQTPGVYIG